MNEYESELFESIEKYSEKILEKIRMFRAYQKAQEDYKNLKDNQSENFIDEYEFGNFRIVFDKNNPAAAESWKQIKQGGDSKKSNAISDAQISEKEEEQMKYIVKRKDGRWCGRKSVNGIKICVYGKTKLEAKEKLEIQEKSAKTQPDKVTELSKANLEKFALWWLDTYKIGNITDDTYKNYKWVISAHFHNIKEPITKITTIQLQELLNNLPATRIRKEVYKLLKQIFKKAFELDFIRKDISAFLVLGKINEGQRNALSLEEQKKLIGALEKQNDIKFFNRIMFYLCTGARPSEIATIKLKELRPNWLKINGTKTSGAERWVKISEKMYKTLSEESEDFFKFDNKRFRERLQRFCKENNICDRIDVYTLRHTFATNLYILRIPEKDRQTYMGHKSGSAMTNDVYTTFSPDTKPQDIYDIYGDWYPEF